MFTVVVPMMFDLKQIKKIMCRGEDSWPGLKNIDIHIYIDTYIYINILYSIYR